MNGNDVFSFITTGILKGISIGMPVSSVINTLGQPNDYTGDDKVGYLFYGIISFGYTNNTIYGMAIYFFQDRTIKVTIEENDFGETSQIHGNTLIHEFVYMLNSRNLLWKCCNTKSLDYFTIQTNKGIGMIFDLNDGSLNRISYTGRLGQ
jgi:hypothetical protein